jgi:hypothetical protein
MRSALNRLVACDAERCSRQAAGLLALPERAQANGLRADCIFTDKGGAILGLASAGI